MINNSIAPLVPGPVPSSQIDNSVSNVKRNKSRMMGPPGISSTFIGHIATLADIDEESKSNNGAGVRMVDVSLPSTVVVTTSNGPPFFNMNSRESILAGI